MKANTALIMAVGLVVLSGCASAPAAVTLPDGEYTGTSQPDSDGTTGEVHFTVADKRVTDATFMMYDKDGTPHDENYGKTSSGEITDPEFYQRAQDAIEAEKKYLTQFEKTGDQNKIDRIAGASLSHRLFVEAVGAAVNQGK